MSHEIRTPLNAILGFAQVLQNADNLDESQKKYLGIISQSGDHLLALINDILEMSKIEAGKIKLNPVTFNIHSLMKNIEEMFRMRIEKKNIRFDIVTDPGMPSFILADEKRIRQVLINLIGNAYKFTEEGNIMVHAQANRKKMEISVLDTGSGIPPENHASVFEIFRQTTEGETQSEGSGLGLAISREIARLMGGDILLESTPGKGSVFSFSFNFQNATPAEGSISSGKNNNRKLKENNRGMRVLVVDDISANRMVARAMLEKLGFEIREAENGLVALEMAKIWKPQLILMDLVMPKMDGATAIKEIRKSPEGNFAKIIVISANIFDENRDEILSNGANAFLAKPYKESELLDEIQKHCEIEFE